MSQRWGWIACCVGLGWGLAGEVSATEPQCLLPPSPEDYERAGYPLATSKFAIVDRNPHYTGNYVGGGALCRGDGRYVPQDGTWGYDYIGKGWYPGRIFLGWYHDRPLQPQFGKYESFGPHVTDIFAAQPLRRPIIEHFKENREGGEHGGEGH